MHEQKPLVLVADDDPDILKLVSVTLRLEEFRVLTAADGSEALHLACDEHPDLVIENPAGYPSACWRAESGSP